MATRITLVLEETSSDEDIRQLNQFLLTDALYEYFTARQGDYVNRVYAHLETEDLRAKRATVARRVEIAKKLHQATCGVQVETFVGPCKQCGAPGMADAVYDPPVGDDPRRCDECGML